MIRIEDIGLIVNSTMLPNWGGNRNAALPNPRSVAQGLLLPTASQQRILHF